MQDRGKRQRGERKGQGSTSIDGSLQSRCPAVSKFSAQPPSTLANNSSMDPQQATSNKLTVLFPGADAAHLGLLSLLFSRRSLSRQQRRRRTTLAPLSFKPPSQIILPSRTYSQLSCCRPTSAPGSERPPGLNKSDISIRQTFSFRRGVFATDCVGLPLLFLSDRPSPRPLSTTTTSAPSPQSSTGPP